ncbi:MAG: filamentous hemagglutinin family protein [Methylococcaceae bacterium]
MFDHAQPVALTALKPLTAYARLVLAGLALIGSHHEALAGELPVPKATFVTAGRADYAIEANTLKINQQSDRSILNWQSFNVGKENTVRFAQPSVSSITLNRIDQADPSHILGQIKANGQIYLINRNGFLFGKDARIDTNSMVVSTLDVSDETFNRGLTKVVDQDGRAGLTGTGEVYRKDADGNVLKDANGNPVKARIDIEAGAEITAGQNGRLIFAAPAIDNAGSMTAPEGQIIMAAASDKVYLQEAGSNSKLRGLLVEVGSGGEVMQRGKLMAEHGNVTLVGFAVNQSGRVSASTSVRSAGSVKLLAREGGQSRREGEQWIIEPTRTTRNEDLGDGLGKTSRLVLGTGSVTEATPNLNDTDKAVDGQTQDKSWMELMGQTVVLQKNATLRSRSGDVTLSATENPAQVGLPVASSKNKSRIFIDEGAVIDVSGVRDVAVPMERNVVEVELRSNELRDSPLQRDGILYAQKVNVDIRKGTPLADISGAIERIERTVAERSTLGGHLNLTSEGDTIIRPLSLLNFSGGSVAYQNGFIDTTQLMSQGKIYDIGSADPNRIYDSIVNRLEQTFEAWNLTQKYQITGTAGQGHFEQGYIDGKDAGSLNIKTNALLLDGDLQGSAVNGMLQREPAQQAKGGSLSVDLVSLRAPDSTITQPLVFQTGGKSVVLGESDSLPLNPDDAGQTTPLRLPSDFYQRTGILTADIKTAGNVHIGRAEHIEVVPSGSLAIRGGKIQVEGSITATSGRVSLATQVPTTLTVDGVNPYDGSITLGSAASIVTAGLWHNQLPGRNSVPDNTPIYIDGGQVTLTAQGNVNIQSGSRIDVSGGGLQQANRNIKPGNAGTIALSAANDIGGQGSTLKVDGEMSGYALKGGRGGSVRLASSEIIIREGDDPASPDGGTDPQPLILSPEFFRRGGFGRFTVESNKQGVTIDEGSNIIVQVANRILKANYTGQPSGTDLSRFTEVEYLPVDIRPSGELNIVLSQHVGLGNDQTALSMKKGSAIRTDARGTVSLTSDTRLLVDGLIEAPGGAINLHLTTPTGSADPGFMANQTVWLSGDARLSASGTALTTFGPAGLRVGEVLPGGHIELLADRGFIVMGKGSSLDVSGTQAELDLPAQTQLGANTTTGTVIPSNGGLIDIHAADGVIMQGSIKADGGQGKGAAGGIMNIVLDPRTRAEPPELAPGQTPFPSATAFPSTIELVDHTLPADDLAGLIPGDALPSERYGKANLVDTSLSQSGLSGLKLSTPDRIQWRGNVDVSLPGSLVLDAPNLIATDGQGRAFLSAAYMALGGSETRIDDSNVRSSVIKEATTGDGVLTVNADQLDLFGLTVLVGIGETQLASTGDLRMIGVRSSQLQREYQGELLTAGNLSVQASQVYPSTLSDFRVAIVNNASGILSIKPSDREPSDLVLSAGGTLSIEAANILQSGTIKVPQGELKLTATDTLWLAPGSLTSNNMQSAVVPFGRTQGGLDWVYPLTGQNLVYAPQPQADSLSPPVKSLSLSAQSVQIDRGAKVDTSGSGDLYAFEFIPGPGGSVDVLDSNDAKYLDGRFTYQEKYAIIPGLGSSYSPYDPLEYPVSGLGMGDQVYLSAMGSLKAGTYTLLPPHYALLPGAYLVTVEPNTQDIQPGQNLTTLGGDPIVAGYRKTADTDYHDARWSGFSIETGAVLRTRAEYTDSYANSFFTDRAAQLDRPVPLLPRDAGSVRLSAGSSLALQGILQSVPDTGGKGGRLDIEASNLAIISASQMNDPVLGYVNIQADDLNRLGVASIVLGGLREPTTDGIELKTRAANVMLGQDAHLSGKEFILTAKDSITLQSGSEIRADAGITNQEAVEYRLAGDSAFMQVSSGTEAGFIRSDVLGDTGSIQIDAGATLAASGSIIADSTKDTQLQGIIQMDGGSLTLGASRIGLGQLTGGSTPGGLMLSSEILKDLKVDNLTLNSGSSLDLYPGVDLQLQNVVIRADAVLGYAPTGETSRLTAQTIRFENPESLSVVSTATGQADLQLNAGQIQWGRGDIRFQGFAKTEINASQEMYGSGAGVYTFANDVYLDTPVFSAGYSADTLLDATGHHFSLSNTESANIPGTVQDRLGSRLDILADAINTSSAIELPSGSLKLTALTGDLVLGEGSLLSVAGREAQFGDNTLMTDAGRMDLVATQGNVNLNSGVNLYLTGTTGGLLNVTAPAGAYALQGQIKSQGINTPGSFVLDAQLMPAGMSLGNLLARLSDSGFADQLNIRVRTGDLFLDAGETVKARSFNLTADSGSIRVAGQISLAGRDAQLALVAGDDLILAETAQMGVQGTSGHSGISRIEAVDGDHDGKGTMQVQPGAELNMANQDGSGYGQASLRVLRNSEGVLAFSGDAGALLGKTSNATLEAVRVYPFEGTISTRDISGWKQDTDAFMTQATSIEKQINLPGGLRPGLEIQARNDLALGSDGWDLLQWRYDGRPGVLSLIAGGDLSINGHLSDGFKTYDEQGIDLSGLLGAGATLAVKDMIQPGLSWGYRLISGRDLTIANETMVRTGTGDITVETGRDFILGNADSVLYTAGRPTDTDRYGSLKNAFVAYSFYGEYPVDGGNIKIDAGRDIQGAVTGQFFDGWLTRTGDWSRKPDHTGETPTAWAISLGRPDLMNDGSGLSQGVFAQNIGALGGGDVTITALGDIRDLSVMLPVTGKQTGEPTKPSVPDDTNYNTNVTEQSAGGNLVLDAGGDILGGTYYVARGTGDISARGSIKASDAMNGRGSLLALGDSQFNLSAGSELVLAGSLNPTVVKTPDSNNFFFTYTADSGVKLTSLSGDITLQNDYIGLLGNINSLRPIDGQLSFNSTTQSALQVYPASVNATALQGNISLDASLVTYPSNKGSMSFLADGSILTGNTGSNVNITQSDADPELLPKPDYPAASNFDDAAQRLDPFGRADLTHARVPLYKGTSDSVQLYARTGGILPVDPLLFTLAQPVSATAGGDIRDASFNIQHSDYAISSMELGGNFIFTSPRNAQGNLINLTRQVQLSGPGQLWIMAGGSIDLGASKGILTIGNTFNTALSEDGASVTVISGLKTPMDFSGFAKTYDPASDNNRPVLVEYFRKRSNNPDLTDTDALNTYELFTDKEKREVLIWVFFEQLKKSATAAALSGIKSDYDSGFAAIDSLFPGQDAASATGKYQGDLKLFFSTIKTVDGGDINILTPGGYVNAGLAVSFSGSKSASDLGLVVQGKGQLNAFVNGDFQVNQSRVFAMGGGDIAIWSSNGDIDAGRGAKAALAVPPPLVSFDEQGNLQIIYPPAVSGSGIRTASSNPAISPGNVILAAPRGVVDAGEAGIGGNNIIIAANAVIGASNIDVGGSSVGVPTTSVSIPVGAAGAAAAAASAAQSAQQSVAANNDKSQAAQSATNKTPILNSLDIEVVGFGDCSIADVKEGKAGCG